ncbi:MAG: hypothetical protein MUF31_04760 [Akkermansiaceae bacterium]|jgi:hypothetical protein|nr:hypothetical protein [Akkermansiaceae bacterium]
MRGSPLIRTFCLCLGLILAALAVHGLTRRESATITAPVTHQPTEEEEVQATRVPFEITLSAPAREVMVESAGEQVKLGGTELVVGGELTVTDEHPVIFVTIRWADSAEVPRFAKMRIEPPSLPTRTHTFDAMGDIDDVWEPHLH